MPKRIRFFFLLKSLVKNKFVFPNLFHFLLKIQNCWMIYRYALLEYSIFQIIRILQYFI